MTNNLPEKVKVIMYHVGFGDCFLLKFTYPNENTHCVLIDCGTWNKDQKHMSRILDKLTEDCNGHVDAIVATHRHKDHISAFGVKKLAEKLENLNPDIVIQPWTEHPDAEDAALKAPNVFTRNAVKHIMGLNAAQEFTLKLYKNPNRVLPASSPETRRRLSKIASLNIPNKKAIKKLASIGKRNAYVYAGGPSGLEEILPGVNVHVLGPPTLEQTETIREQTTWDENEFWKLYASLANTSSKNIATRRGKSILFPDEKTMSVAKSPSYIKWVIHKLDKIQLQHVKLIVRDLDDAMNNTSVILLFEVGSKYLLFPGDAQLENWQYCLNQQEFITKLRKTVLYKVGHHGSTNATPKSLWNVFQNRSDGEKRMTTLMSTKRGIHHKVPRESLYKALDCETYFYSTKSWRNKLKEEIEVELSI